MNPHLPLPPWMTSLGTSVRLCRRGSARVFGLLATALLLFACGGGGGGGDGGSTPGGGGTPPPASVSGVLWHDFFPVGPGPGLLISPLDSRPTSRVDALSAGAPTPDGAHFVVAEYDLAADTSRLSIKSSGTLSLVDTALLDGYAKDIRPSPRRLGDLLLSWGSSASANDAVVTVVDLPGRQILQQLASAVAADWLPDGRLLALEADGRVSTGAVGAAGTTAGRVAVPGWTPRDVRVNGGGSHMIMRWVRLNESGDVAETDLWIARIDGGELARLTRTGITARGLWSPDGQAFAFDTDASYLCSGPFGCGSAGFCELFWAPVTAREIAGGSSSGVSVFTVAESDGDRATAGCDLLGWTR
jgi:hypothetical protein